MRNQPSEVTARPTVTCIIIFFNEEKFLSASIDSVLAQTYSDWELLLVDDGSTDKSSALAREYASSNPCRIRYLRHASHANEGMSASRNLGLRHARGRLIALLDGDDVWFDDKLARQVELFEHHPEAVMVCGATEHWYSWDPDTTLGSDFIVFTGQGAAISLPQDHLYRAPELVRALYPLGRGASPSTSGLMFSHTLIDSVGAFEDSFRGLFEDQVFCIKAYLHGSVYISSRCFDRYRQHVGSCTYLAQSAGETDIARRAFLKWLDRYLKYIACEDADIRWRSRSALLRAEHRWLWLLAHRFRALVRAVRDEVSCVKSGGPR